MGITPRLLSAVSGVVIVATAMTASPASHAPSNQFALSYSAEHLRPGKHYQVVVDADFGVVDMNKAVTRQEEGVTKRAIGRGALATHQPAASKLRWAFTVPPSGILESQTFLFSFPSALVGLPDTETWLFLTLDIDFEGVDARGQPAVHRSRQTLPVKVGPSGPDPDRRCLQFTGEPNGAFRVMLVPACSPSAGTAAPRGGH